MASEKCNILRGNITVLGNFNPAILRLEFLEQEFDNWSLGKGKLVSPEHVPLVADIRFGNVRLFMDLNRMIVEDMKLASIQQMKSPGIVRDYLRKLPYTPLRMIGLNLSAEAESKDLEFLWENVANPRRIPKIVENVGSRLRNLSLRYVFPILGPQLAEVTLVADEEATGLRVQLTLTKPPESARTGLSFNGEFSDVGIEKSRIDFFADHFSEVGQMFLDFLDVFDKEAT